MISLTATGPDPEPPAPVIHIGPTPPGLYELEWAHRLRRVVQWAGHDWTDPYAKAAGR